MPKHKKKSQKHSDKNGNSNVADPTLDSYYRLTMATGAPTYKIILCGEYGVGKSSLFRRFMNDTFMMEKGKKSTIGLDQASQSFHVGGEEVKVNKYFFEFFASVFNGIK